MLYSKLIKFTVLRRIISLLGHCAMVSGLLTGQTHAESLQILTLSTQTLPEQVAFSGRIKAVNQATVSAETQGRVKEVTVKIGDTVPAGTVLITMTSTEQYARLEQAEAQLTDAQSNLATDSAEHQRIADLQQKGYASKTDMDKATTRLEASKARVNSAKAVLRAAQEQLSYTEVKAPFSGVVSGSHIDVGEAVRPGTLLLSGYDPTAFRVEVDVPQRTAEKIRQRRQATIHLASASRPADNRVIEPRAIILYPIIDPATSTVRVRLELPRHLPDIYPGQFVLAIFTTGESERLLIPRGAVVYRSEVAAVYIQGEDQLQLRQIRAGAQHGDNIEVLAGLTPGEKLALDPVAAARLMVTRKADNME